MGSKCGSLANRVSVERPRYIVGGYPMDGREQLHSQGSFKALDQSSVWDAQTQTGSCGPLIFVNQPAKPIASHHKPSVRVGSIVIHRWTVRRREVQASVRPMPVVMINEDGEDTFKVTRTQNEQPIGALGTDGPNESFRDRIERYECRRPQIRRQSCA